MEKKTFFSGLFKFVANKQETSGGAKISKQQALMLQKDYVDHLKQSRKNVITPPYKEIIKQLDSEKSEIFCAAVYYLAQIAQNEPKYYDEIVIALQKILKQNKRSDKELEYLRRQLQTAEKNS